MTALSPKCLESHSDIWIHLQGLMTLECILLRTAAPISATPIDFKSEKLVCGECSLVTFSSKLKLRIEKALKAKHTLNRLHSILDCCLNVAKKCYEYVFSKKLMLSRIYVHKPLSPIVCTVLEISIPYFVLEVPSLG